MSKQKNLETLEWWLDMLLLLGLLFLFAGHSFLLDWLLILLKGLVLSLFAVFMRTPDPKIITAESGQDVTLTCRAPNSNVRVLEWSRADLGDKYVLLYQDGPLHRSNQHPSFKNRVDLQDRQMKDGDVSLVLKDVTINDAGTYECRVVERGMNRRKRVILKTEPIHTISLHVVPPDQKIITAESGQDVSLTCRAPNNSFIGVVWGRADLGDEYVLVYRDGQVTPDDQHPSFKNRVDLQDRQMKDGDVSLILKHVTINDAGTYKCGVILTGTRSLEPISIIHLHVDPPDQKFITAESGQDVTLTCRAPNNNIRVVKWSRADLGDEYVLLYQDEQFDPASQHPSFKNRVDLQDRQMKDGDVSLILKNVTINDTGTYECGVVQGVGGPVTLINSTNLVIDPPGQNNITVEMSL